MLQQDLLGIHRGYCRRPECSGCEGFSRTGECFQLAAADIGFRCASCGCTSKEHEQLPQAPSVGLATEASQAGYHAHRHLCVGDLVQLKTAEASTAKRGIVLDILESGPFGLCSAATAEVGTADSSRASPGNGAATGRMNSGVSTRFFVSLAEEPPATDGGAVSFVFRSTDCGAYASGGVHFVGIANTLASSNAILDIGATQDLIGACACALKRWSTSSTAPAFSEIQWSGVRTGWVVRHFLALPLNSLVLLRNLDELCLRETAVSCSGCADVGWDGVSDVDGSVGGVKGVVKLVRGGVYNQAVHLAYRIVPLAAWRLRMAGAHALAVTELKIGVRDRLARYVHLVSQVDITMLQVELLRESGMPVPEERFISVRAAELRVQAHASVGSWSPPRVLGGFDREENFKNLVFQPEGLHSLVPALKRRRCSICVLGGSISLQARGYRPNLVRALERRGVAVEDLPAAVGTAGSRPLALVVHDMVLTKRPDLLIVEANSVGPLSLPKSTKLKQDYLAVFVQLTRMVPAAVWLLAFFDMLSVFPPLGHTKCGAVSVLRIYLCLLPPESCLAVIIGPLLVGSTVLPGRRWISLVSNFVRLRLWLVDETMSNAASSINVLTIRCGLGVHHVVSVLIRTANEGWFRPSIVISVCVGWKAAIANFPAFAQQLYDQRVSTIQVIPEGDFIEEVAVNDGDDLLESTPNSNAISILQAAEGIVRSVRRGSPGTTIVFLEMFLRDDMEARMLKTGSEAWQHSSMEEAIMWYHDVAPRLHRHVCSHYGLAQIDLIPALRSLGVEQRSEWFRDDCHHSDAGGEALGNLLAKLLLWAVRQPALTALKVPAAPSVPAALDAGCWCNGKTIRVLRGWLSPASLVSTRRDKDLLHLGQQADWLLLYTAGKATIPFKGSSCGLMTLLGPDAPCLQVRVDGGAVRRLSLLDQWCFYWRDAVVLLCDGLAMPAC
ncbi:hypothetical protein AK812_SmicGene23690 [Symbiodinium microadriaticum]|uniref:Uncharacterized protein n=1 Tax=Symbiodinium microadriaticum TaxID=2951 RepID=A0A1Q9DGK3_SYMMI|nr:hypothetical protein AK812_SmicGene23690 [Symbiodinium microadriaticum]